ncbi:glycosyltransferase family 2 protein [Flavobacterium salmonis]|uniref:Glycosyl transferase n=1 Tax=Flavobacterium salmonis TaxID=2654844 RepID=A0A6V6Z9Y3_9FLAO|nr:glycosyltransferase family A protein [Flavobacterium salmonis]CAD0008465.1 glycosyl transferase [Flavobacterium salmonis]
MIAIYHENNNVVQVEVDAKPITFSQNNIARTLFEMSELYPNSLLIWCHIDLKPNLNLAGMDTVFHHNKIMVSYNPIDETFLSEAIGYCELSSFIKINKKVSYPSWLVSSFAGGIHTSVLNTLKDSLSTSGSFDYFLNSLAKLAMPEGLLCYSEPQLLTGFPRKIATSKKNIFVLFRFVKQHYKIQWIFLLFLNLFLYERKIPVLPFVFSLFYVRRKLSENILDEIEVSSKEQVTGGKIDVIIPTIGRKDYLYNVLQDLKIQTSLPSKVIIVEQNPNPLSISELDYLTCENWPFSIEHIFTHQTGACNARNLALKEIKSEWVFMADDDIRLEKYFLEKALEQIKLYGIKAATFNCFQKNEKLIYKKIFQWPTFGSGCSIVKHQFIKNMQFNMKFEFGFGEDADFGMQLRNQGVDVIYFPKPEVLHLKAPIGGFRTKPVLPWHNDKIQPKPSPTVMLYDQLHLSKQQIKGYKTILFFKFYKLQTIKNPIRYFLNFKMQWKQSEYWANELKNKK